MHVLYLVAAGLIIALEILYRFTDAYSSGPSHGSSLVILGYDHFFTVPAE